MPDPNPSPSPPPPAADVSPPASRSLLGRVVVYSIYAVISSFLVVASVGSVAGSLYGEPARPSAEARGLTQSQREWCVRQLKTLKSDLQGQAQLELGHPLASDTPLRRWQRWRQDWQRRLQDARSRCATPAEAPLRRAYAALESLFRTYDSAVSGFVGRGHRLRAILRRELEAVSEPPGE